MKKIIDFLFANNLENLDEFKINGEISLKKELVIEAMVEAYKYQKESKSAKSKTSKSKGPEVELSEEAYKALIENIEVEELNLAANKEKVSVRFNIKKGETEE